jgi:membrane-associated protease RseP (regulator of RpoE activity)
MILLEPPSTRFDLKFAVAGVPVRVHPLFWLVAVLLGFSGRDPVLVLIWVGVVFVSILVHEFGHALAMRHYGESPRVVLHALGGLTIADPTPWGRTWANISPGGRQQLLISAAGPGAGFLLAGLVVAVTIAAGLALGLGAAIGDAQVPASGLRYLDVLITSLLWVNIGWGLINLLPVYPLDGGNISRQLFLMADPLEGVRKSLWVSVGVGVAAAAFGLLVLSSLYIGMLFGFLAFSSYGLLRGQGIGRL